MRMEKRKSLEKRIFTVMLAGVLVVASMTTTLAASGSNSWSIGGFSISGTNKVTSTYGKGTTGGSAKPYYNRVIVSIYNKKGKQQSIGSNTKQDALASKTVYGVNPKRVYSCHGVYDKNYSFVDGKTYGISTTR